jgi:hypothetical protein
MNILKKPNIKIYSHNQIIFLQSTVSYGQSFNNFVALHAGVEQ